MKDTRLIKDTNNYQDTNIIYDRYMSKITFNYDNDSKLMLPLTYYKGYSAIACTNNECTNISVSNDPIYKRVVVDTLDNEYTYTIQYKGTIIQYVSLTISILSISILIMYMYYE